jgi:D-alanyl-D-alanine carboxypeptidase
VIPLKKIIFIIILFGFITNVKAIDTSATSAILMDMDSNRILYAKDIHNVRTVASISKILTTLVVLENTDIKKEITVKEEIKKAYGSGIYIQEGEKLTIESLLYGLMLRSGNDAAVTLAVNTSKTVEDFVKKMNETATKIGMIESTFNNPSGLDEEDGNFSSAYDMAILTSYAFKNETFRKITSTKEYKLTTNKNTYLWKNKHKLLQKYDYVIGGKTGFTEKARRTLVTMGSKDDLNLVVVTLNDGNDWNDHINLLNYGFNTYKNYELIKEGTIDVYDDTYYSDYDLYVKENLKYPLTEEESKNVVLKFELSKNRIIENDTIVGKVKVFVMEEEIGSRDIYVQEKTKEQQKSNFKKLIEWFKKIW